MGIEQANSIMELQGSISNLIKNVAGNTCKHCRETFIPNKKNDELCSNCLLCNAKFCSGCGSAVTFLYDDVCCYECYEKYKKPCIRCGDYCLYQDNSNTCRYCRYY